MKCDTEICNHRFVRDPFTKLFKCVVCGLEVRGDYLKEWRE